MFTKTPEMSAGSELEALLMDNEWKDLEHLVTVVFRASNANPSLLLAKTITRLMANRVELVSRALIKSYSSDAEHLLQQLCLFYLDVIQETNHVYDILS